MTFCSQYPRPQFKITLLAQVVLALASFFYLATAASATQQVVILNDAPAYASLDAAKAGEKTDKVLEGYASMPVGLLYAYSMIEEKDGWMKIDSKAVPEWATPPSDAPVWVKSSAAIRLENFLEDPQYHNYTTCPEKLPYSFTADLGPSQKNGRIIMVPRPTLYGGSASIEIYDSGDNRLWTSDNPAPEDGGLAICRGSMPESALWVRAVGDFDGDGWLEVITGANQMFEVAPADFNLLRWNGERLEYIRPFKLEEAPDAIVWQLRSTGLDDGTMTSLFARAEDMQSNPDGSIDFTIFNWQNPDTGVARMRLSQSGDHFTLIRWVRPMGAAK